MYFRRKSVVRRHALYVATQSRPWSHSLEAPLKIKAGGLAFYHFHQTEPFLCLPGCLACGGPSRQTRKRPSRMRMRKWKVAMEEQQVRAMAISSPPTLIIFMYAGSILPHNGSYLLIVVEWLGRIESYRQHVHCMRCRGR